MLALAAGRAYVLGLQDMLKPGKGKTHKAYLWSYCTTAFDPVNAVVFDFAESRAGQHARDFLGVDTNVPQRLARHARLRRLLGLQGRFRTWRDRGRLPSHTHGENSTNSG